LHGQELNCEDILFSPSVTNEAVVFSKIGGIRVTIKDIRRFEVP